MNYLTEEQVEKQEHLSKERLALLKPRFLHNSLDERPKANLIDLMHWVKTIFSTELYSNNKVFESSSLHPWIHNKIVIDGSFLEFAEQNKIKVECLYRDSIASWKSEKDFEHFMAQGVFKITQGKLQFLHAALFHKGNQNEDEVSFFVIVDDKDYEAYLKLRNSFDSWLSARDREHLEIHVVGGEGQPYTRNLSWEELFMPDSLKKDIKGSIEGFLAAKELYQSKNIPWKRGILLYGEPGCGKTSCIRTIISNYDLKPVTVQNSASTNDDTITEAFAYAEDQGPSLLYFEDLDTLLTTGQITLSHFLNLMDGVSSKDGIFVIATANDISRLKQSVTDRPSRFDRKWEVPLPDIKMAIKYLKKWFGNSLKDKDLSVIASHAVQNKFSYSYLKELYITSAYNALAVGRKNPSVKDIKDATKQLLGDKKKSNDGFISESHEDIGIK